MTDPGEDLEQAGLARLAREAALEWGLELGPPFALSRYSFVAPVGADAVLKIGNQDDDESLHEPEALVCWAGDGAVRVLRANPARRALLLERALPGTDLASLPSDLATDIAVAVALRLWRPAAAPFRWIGDHVPVWLEQAAPETAGARALLTRARRLWAGLDVGSATLIHGDLHHHNILAAGDRWLAIDPKPMLGEPEFDVPPFLWNPLGTTMTLGETEHRLDAFAAAGLDQARMRRWALIRGAYLRIGDWLGPAAVAVLEAIQPD